MKLSTKSTYGLRAVLDIALGCDKAAVRIGDISRQEGISQTYLEQLLNKLKKKGLLNSVRGPKGGYVLSRNPEEITVADVVRVLEGSISPIHCIAIQKDPLKRSCKRSGACVPKIVWTKLAKAINDCLESITLKDLCVEAKRLDSRSGRRRML